MGVKRDGHRLRVEGTGALKDGGDHPAMAAVDSVEVADRDHRGRVEGAEFSERAGDLHEAISNVSLRPSCARRMCAGNEALMES